MPVQVLSFAPMLSSLINKFPFEVSVWVQFSVPFFHTKWFCVFTKSYGSLSAIVIRPPWKTFIFSRSPSRCYCSWVPKPPARGNSRCRRKGQMPDRFTGGWRAFGAHNIPHLCSAGSPTLPAAPLWLLGPISSVQLTGPWPIHLAQELLEQRKCSKCLFFSSHRILPSNLAEHFSPEGNMAALGTPQPGFTPCSRHELCTPDPKGERVGRLERWRGEDVSFREVVGLWPYRTAPCLLPSGNNSPHLIA